MKFCMQIQMDHTLVRVTFDAWILKFQQNYATFSSKIWLLLCLIIDPLLSVIRYLCYFFSCVTVSCVLFLCPVIHFSCNWFDVKYLVLLKFCFVRIFSKEQYILTYSDLIREMPVGNMVPAKVFFAHCAPSFFFLNSLYI